MVDIGEFEYAWAAIINFLVIMRKTTIPVFVCPATPNTAPEPSF